MSPLTREQSSLLRKERQRQILDAARQVFAEKGFAATRVSDVAAQAGVSQGTIYWYFQSKDDLFMAVFEEWMGSLAPTYAEFSAMPGTVEEKVRHHIRATARIFAASQDFLPVQMEFWTQIFRADAIQEQFRALFATLRASLIAILQEGMASGVFRDDLDTVHLASLLIAVYDGLILQWAADPEAVDWQKIGATLADVVLEGLMER